MAHIDQIPTLLPNLTSKEENEKAVEGEGRVWGDGEVKASGDSLPTPFVADGGTMENVLSTSLPRPTPARPSLVPLGSQTTPAAPQPKKFSTVNITKRFLEKNSSASGSASNSTSLTIKSGAPLGKSSLPYFWSNAINWPMFQRQPDRQHNQLLHIRSL